MDELKKLFCESGRLATELANLWMRQDAPLIVDALRRKRVALVCARKNVRRKLLRDRSPAWLEHLYRRAVKQQQRRTSAPWAQYLRDRFVKALKSRRSAVVLEMASESADFVRAHLEKQFVPGMSWDNHGTGPGCWHIDHIRPLASFMLADDSAVKQAFHYSNLQPLWEKENILKRDKFVFTA